MIWEFKRRLSIVSFRNKILIYKLYSKWKKESPYHGADLTSGDIETKELEVKGNENDFFFFFYFGFNEYITHIKIMTKLWRGRWFWKDIKSDNKLLFFSGYFSPKGVRSIRMNYMNYISSKIYVYYRIIEFPRLRYILKKWWKDWNDL